MSRDYQKEALNTEFGYRILRLIYLDKSDTPSEIAKNLDSKNTSISNYLKGLRNENLVKKADKQGRSQPYEANKDVLLEKLFDYWNEKTIKLKEETEEEIQTLEKIKNEMGAQKFFRFPREYIDEYLESNEEATISNMIQKDFAWAIFFMYYYFDEYPDYIEPYTKQIIVSFTATSNASKTVVGMKNAVEMID
jgi:DNA-binding transcriptional regulator GbsR (MarR family)